MEIDVSLVGKNIQCLRTTHKESKTDLAKALHVRVSAITNYEKGDRLPERTILSDIAKHYNITEDQLLHEKFSEEIEIDLSVSKLIEASDFLFPFVTTEKAMKNDHFARAHRFYKEISEKSKRLQGITLYEFEKITTELDEAEKDDSIIEEVSANTLALWYVFISSTLMFWRSIADQTATSKLVIESDKRISHQYKGIEIDKKGLEAFEEIIRNPELLQEIEEKKRIVVNSTRWSQLGYYYMALGFLCNDVRNDLSASLNKTIGEQLMISLASVGNPHAQLFVKTSRDMAKLKHHSA